MDDWYQDEAAERREPRHQVKSWLKELIQIFLIVALVRIGMDTFLPRYVVDGASMQPNFATSQRVIGLPNETIVIQDGRVYVNGKLLDETYVNDFCTMRSCNGEWQLGPDQYFVLGDNRSHSLDSHAFGPVSRSAIIGIARVRYWPPDKAELITAPEY
jgi:signal peptidase I